MKRHYECWECHHTFEADDSEQVVCPKCGSDNVEIASKRINKRVWYAALIIALLIIIGLISYWVYLPTGPTNLGEEQMEESMIVGPDTITETDYKVEQPPILSMEGETPEFTEEGYKFKMKLQHPPKGEFKFVLLDAFDDKKVIAESPNGQFEKVPFSEAEGGSYRVVLRSSGGKELSSKITVIGFIKQSKVTKKMTVAELQNLLNKGDNSLLGVGENDWLSPEVELSFTGMPSDVINIPTTLAQVIEKLQMEDWKKAEIKKLEYDDMNRIKKIYIHVTPNNAF